MIELNESLAEGEHHHMALIEEYQKNKSQENEDIYLSCKCEIALYKKLAESLKESVRFFNTLVLKFQYIILV